MSASYHYCPICRKVKIYRKEVKTCGSYDCISVWRRLNTQQRGDLINQAAQIMSDEIDELIKELRNQQGERDDDRMIPLPPTSLPTATNKSKTIDRDNQFLTKVFGDDAPGIVRDDKKDDDC